MGRDRRRSPFGSARGRLFKEPERRSTTRRRSQSVKFRRKYATSVLTRAAKTAWLTIRVVFGVALVAAAAFGARHVWRYSGAFAVQSIRMADDLPADVRRAPPVRVGENLFFLKTDEVAAQVARAHPEIENVQVRRHLNRSVSIRASYRVPVAVIPDEKAPKGVDRGGVVFTLTPQNGSVAGLPSLSGNGTEGRGAAVDSLEAWKTKWAPFYALVENVETDRMRPLRVRLKNGAVIDWGVSGAPERAERVLKLLERFRPVRVPAMVRFVDSDRLIVDANWSSVETVQKGGSDRVKT